jgi:hypothetical protein
MDLKSHRAHMKEDIDDLFNLPVDSTTAFKT